MQNRFRTIDVLDESFYTTEERKIFFLARTLIDQANFDAVIQKREFAQALGDNFIVKFDVLENFLIGHEVHFGSAPFGITEHAQGRYLYPVVYLDQAISNLTAAEFQLIFFTVTADRQTQPL